jgi:hypothetical protein
VELVKKLEALYAVAIVVGLHPLDSPAIEWNHMLGHGLVTFLATLLTVAKDKIESLTLALVVIKEASKPQFFYLIRYDFLNLSLVRNLNRQI